MRRDVKLQVFYPHAPERVWRMLTSRQALSAWLMDNDFEPRLGHQFCFQAHSLPGLDGTVHCQVTVLDAPKRLAYTWQDALMARPSQVTWTLWPVEGGTQLRLEHRGWACESDPVSASLADCFTRRPAMALSLPEQCGGRPRLETQVQRPGIEFGFSAGWSYWLNDRLPLVLEQAADRLTVS